MRASSRPLESNAATVLSNDAASGFAAISLDLGDVLSQRDVECRGEVFGADRSERRQSVGCFPLS